MKRLDRHLAVELAKYAVIACVSVVAIYLLVDIFEELTYFTSRKVSLPLVLLYYLYSLPAAVSLLYPVSMLLAVFLVYGQMTRHGELAALQSAGVRPTRVFAPALALGAISVFLYLGANELVTVPCNARLTDLRRYRIERRQAQAARSGNLYFVGEGGRIFYIRELRPDSTMADFTVTFLDADRRVSKRYDVQQARWRAGHWLAAGVTVRSFADGAERVVVHDSLALTDVAESPADLSTPNRPVGETSTAALASHIRRMKRAGENVAKEEVEFHYRFSYALIGLIVVLLGLPVSIRLRRGGIMLGLGLGLLLSFLYWGAIQTSRAYGTSHIVSPAMAAWLPNIVFGALAAALLVRSNA
jgi:lipopolysaccharide export system permease protein